jgi:hypothetical protein
MVRLFSGGCPLPVSPFIARFLGGVCRAMAAALRAPAAARSLEFTLEREAVTFRVDGAEVPLGLGQGFAETIVRDTLRGMTRGLKGIDPEAALRVEVDVEAGTGVAAPPD